MAKLVFLIVIIAAAAVTIQAADHDKGVRFSIKILLHNMAQGDVSLNVLANSELSQNVYIARDMDTVPVVAQTGQWTALGPFTTTSTIVHLSVAVSNSRHGPVKKTLAINLLKYFRYSDLSAGGSSLVLTALESWRLKSGKYLVIKLGLREVVLAFKM
ncbi:hypothetical protein KC19_11G108800 [Ceratodon purpureus]|uniref:Dirigent protein n=1 Tax=Ceratodon purpureus TaxID=3225 RepID=A0A8T0GDT8_CERPU|nr:hypothetical protein KC19_11G108800 [Ceratodon purpureus]